MRNRFCFPLKTCKIQSKRDRNVRYDHVQVSSGLRLDFGREPVADQGGGGAVWASARGPALLRGPADFRAFCFFVFGISSNNSQAIKSINVAQATLLNELLKTFSILIKSIKSPRII